MIYLAAFGVFFVIAVEVLIWHLMRVDERMLKEARDSEILEGRGK